LPFRVPGVVLWLLGPGCFGGLRLGPGSWAWPWLHWSCGRFRCAPGFARRGFGCAGFRFCCGSRWWGGFLVCVHGVRSVVPVGGCVGRFGIGFCFVWVCGVAWGWVCLGFSFAWRFDGMVMCGFCFRVRVFGPGLAGWLGVRLVRCCGGLGLVAESSFGLVGLRSVGWGLRRFRCLGLGPVGPIAAALRSRVFLAMAAAWRRLSSMAQVLVGHFSLWFPEIWACRLGQAAPFFLAWLV